MIPTALYILKGVSSMSKNTAVSIAETIMRNVLFKYATESIDRIEDHKDPAILELFQRDCASEAINQVMTSGIDIVMATKSMCIINGYSKAGVTAESDRREFETKMAELRSRTVENDILGDISDMKPNTTSNHATEMLKYQ